MVGSVGGAQDRMNVEVPVAQRRAFHHARMAITILYCTEFTHNSYSLEVSGVSEPKNRAPEKLSAQTRTTARGRAGMGPLLGTVFAAKEKLDHSLPWYIQNLSGSFRSPNEIGFSTSRINYPRRGHRNL